MVLRSLLASTYGKCITGVLPTSVLLLFCDN